MTPQLLTKAILIAVALLLIAYDSFAEWKWGPSATISETMREWGYRWPWLLIVWGALCWHFWGQPPAGVPNTTAGAAVQQTP